MKTTILTTLVLMISFGLFAQDMNVTPGTKMTVKPGTQMNFVNGSKLVLEDSPSTAPSFLQEGLVNFSGGGQAHVEQYLTKDTWNMVSSPASDGVINAYAWMYLYSYTESNNTWNAVNYPITQLLNPGQGYFVWPTTTPGAGNPASPDSAVVKGNLNYQDINLTLANTNSSIASGWNVVGNPFPVALYWNGDASWNLNNVGAAMYIKNPVSGNYVVWNYNTGGSDINSGYIATGQGFWVRTADTTGTAASMTLPASQRSHNNASFYKSSGGAFLPEQLLLTVQKEGKTDKTIIGFIEDATVGYDGPYDATYLSGEEGVLSLYSMIGGANYALNHLPSIEEYKIVPIGFEPKLSGEFLLTSEWMESFPEDVPIYLEDIKDSYFQDLRSNPDYVFVADVNDDIHRFNIHFANPLDVEDYKLQSEVHIYAYNKTIYVKIPESLRGDIIVYNMLGEEITQHKNSSGLVKIPVNSSNSYFVVKVISEGEIGSEKVLIR